MRSASAQRHRDDELRPEPQAPPVTVSPTPSALLALQRTAGNAAVGRMLSRLLAGNPPDLKEDGKAVTTWAAPTIADAVGQRGERVNKHGKAAKSDAGPIAVRVKATADTPLTTQPASVDELYDSEDLAPGSSGDKATPAPSEGFTPCTQIRGSVAAPITNPYADNSLFIDPGPKPLDVGQGGIGDCYALATIISIANRDPAKIKQLMEPDNAGGATVTLYKRAAPAFFDFLSDTKYEPEKVHVNAELAFRRDKPDDPARALRSPKGGTKYGFALRGAKLIAASTPKESRWWATINGSVLEIHRDDSYQMARWGPLLEKAIARFSQDHGQYGHGQQASDEREKMSGSGLANISGGLAGFTLTMFYGAAGEVVAGGSGDHSGTSWAADQKATDLLNANQAAFDRLLTLQGRGTAFNPQKHKTAPIVTASGAGKDDAGKQLYAKRFLSAYDAAVKSNAWAASVPETARIHVDHAVELANNWMSAGDSAKAKAFDLWRLACEVAAAQLAATRQAAAGPNHALLDLLLIIKNIETDFAGGTRSVYASHAYSVLAVDIRGTDGRSSDIHKTSADKRRPHYSTIDVERSTITLMNPHHRNAPEATEGDAASGRARTSPPDLTSAQSGQFEISLERFFRLYGKVMSSRMQIEA